jgi:hypothetical protein
MESTIVDGDVTDDLFSGKDSAGKQALCRALNEDAKKKQQAALQMQLFAAAAEILRTRVVVLESAVAAKAYMESCSVQGLRARVVYVDFTQHAMLQSKGAYTKVLAKQATKDLAGILIRKNSTPDSGDSVRHKVFCVPAM